MTGFVFVVRAWLAIHGRPERIEVPHECTVAPLVRACDVKVELPKA